MTPRHLLKLPISAENQERAKFQGPEPAAVVGELRVTCKSFLKDGSLQCDFTGTQNAGRFLHHHFFPGAQTLINFSILLVRSSHKPSIRFYHFIFKIYVFESTNKRKKLNQ